MSEKMLSAVADLRLRADDGVPVVNSRDVAEMFEKDHRHVLRDIDKILDCPDLDRQTIATSCGQTQWFRLSYWQDAQNKTQRSFNMTRDGFTLLVNRWSGPKALAFQIAYIQAFNAMEAALRAEKPREHEVFLEAVRTTVRELAAPLAGRLDHQDKQLDRVEVQMQHVVTQVASIEERVFSFEKALSNKRRNLNLVTKNEHIRSINQLGGRCPCCGVAEVVDKEGDRSNGAEFDHFYQSSAPDVEHTWLICKPCHSELTTGRALRSEREAPFRAYQDKRRRLPGRQVTFLF